MCSCTWRSTTVFLATRSKPSLIPFIKCACIAAAPYAEAFRITLSLLPNRPLLLPALLVLLRWLFEPAERAATAPRGGGRLDVLFWGLLPRLPRPLPPIGGNMISASLRGQF